MDMNEINKVEIWWYALSIVSVFNMGIWTLSFRLLWRNRHEYSPDIFKGRVTLIWLSFIYVCVCAFRSFLPRIDLERICLVDHWLSSVLIGRTITTIAEICFITQCALLLREAGIKTENRFAVLISLALVPIIFIAEGFSWYASITTNYLASVIEESLWTLSGCLLIASFVSLWPHTNRMQRYFLSAAIVFATGFLVFMLCVDVPMYWQRYLLDSASGKMYLSLWQGLRDAAVNYRVNFDWNLWSDEIPWMTLYFTLAVWVSIYLPHATVIEKKISR
jgi:hypothetical protein